MLARPFPHRPDPPPLVARLPGARSRPRRDDGPRPRQVRGERRADWALAFEGWTAANSSVQADAGELRQVNRRDQAYFAEADPPHQLLEATARRGGRAAQAKVRVDHVDVDLVPTQFASALAEARQLFCLRRGLFDGSSFKPALTKVMHQGIYIGVSNVRVSLEVVPRAKSRSWIAAFTKPVRQIMQ